MPEASTSSECGLGGEPELPRQGVAQGHSGSGNGKYWRRASVGGQMHIRIPRLGLFELPRRLSAGSPLQPICELRALLCIAGIVIGVSGNSSSALAEVEEATSQDGYASGYNQSTVMDDLIVNLVGNDDNITGGVDSSYSVFNNPYDEDEFRRYNTDNTNTAAGHRVKLDSPANPDDVFIPAVIWNLDVSTGVNLDHISSEFGSDLGILLEPSDAIRFSPLQFQVASCGGNAAEFRDLEYCGNTYGTTNQSADDSKETGQDNSSATVTAANNSSDTAIGSSNPSTPSLSTPSREIQPDTVYDLSPLMPANVNNFAVQVDPTVVSTLPDQCDDTSASCTTTQINPPAAPVDDPTAPPGLQPPDPVISIGDPGPVSDPLPIFTPPPVASSIPETSTEVMTMIGFGIMVLASRGKRLNSIKWRRRSVL